MPIHQPTISLNPANVRAADFHQVFGRLSVIPVQTYLPIRAHVPGQYNAQVYLLDLSRLTSDESLRLVEHLARRFGLSPAEVTAALAHEGCPILAQDTIPPSIPGQLLF